MQILLVGYRKNLILGELNHLGSEISCCEFYQQDIIHA